MSNRRSTRRLEQRSEREARQPGAAPRAQRQRPARPAARRPAGRFDNLNWTPILAVLVIGVVAAIVVFVVLQTTSANPNQQPDWLKAEINPDPRLPGRYIKPNPGPDGRFGTADDRQHFGPAVTYPICSPEQMAEDAAIADPYADRSAVKDCYNSNPPTSGPHNASPMPFKVLDNPATKENLLHDMEHGGVVIWYNTEDAAVIQKLADIANGELDRRRLVVMSKYTGMEPDTIALTAWSRLDKFTVSDFKGDGKFNEKRVTDFIEEHQRRFNPEGL
jgi:hypothetical protein